MVHAQPSDCPHERVHVQATPIAQTLGSDMLLCGVAGCSVQTKQELALSVMTLLAS